MENSVALAITPSENALIAMPDEIGLNVRKDITVTKTLTDNEQASSTSIETKTNTVVEGNNFYISNNMDEVIDVNLHVVSDSGAIEDQYIAILPGEIQEIPFIVDDSIENESAELIISASWDSGSAEIIKEIDVNVESVVTEVIRDLRKPKDPNPPCDNGEDKDKVKGQDQDKDKTEEVDKNEGKGISQVKIEDADKTENKGINTDLNQGEAKDATDLGKETNKPDNSSENKNKN